MGFNILTKNIGKYIFLVLLQVAVLNNIHLSSLGITPYVYVLFILLLPFETPSWMLLIFAFVTGLSIDMFDDTGGAHAAATVFVAFLRIGVLRAISPRDGYESGILPRISYLGLNWFVKYMLVLIFVHHLIFFYIEVFSFEDTLITFLKIILTTILSSILIIISQYLIYRK